MLQCRLHIVAHDVRLQDCRQRAGCPERVPESDDGAVVVESLCLMHLFVRTTETTVHVREEHGVEHDVVQGGVEQFLLFCVRGLHFYLRQHSVPFPACLCPYLVEVVPVHLCLPVPACAFHIHARDACLYHHFLIALSQVCQQLHVLAADGLFFVYRQVVYIERGATYRAGEGGVEINLLMVCPSVGLAVASDGIVVYLLDVGGVDRIHVVFRLNGAGALRAVFQIYQYRPVCRVPVGVPLHAASP